MEIDEPYANHNGGEVIQLKLFTTTINIKLINIIFVIKAKMWGFFARCHSCQPDISSLIFDDKKNLLQIGIKLFSSFRTLLISF